MTTATATWPTLEELQSAESHLWLGIEQLEGVAHRLEEMADIVTAPSVREGQPRPTLADVGALSWGVEAFDVDLAEAEDRVHRIRRIRDSVALHDVQEVFDGH